MRTLTTPTVDSDALYQTCAESTINAALRARLLGYGPRVSAAADSYRAAALVPEFHTLPRVAVSTAADEELRELYVRTMVRRNSPGRATYDSIKLSAKGGICPLCGERDVSTVDHYLPKESYPDFAILPLNLVPACSQCNFVKRVFFPVNASDQLLHPYFDRLPDGIWLHATVAYQADTPLLIFSAEPPAAWSAEIATRVRAHFDRLALGALYSIHGTREVPMIRSQLERLLQQAGPEAVREHLEEQAATRRAHEPNSWQAATYTALAGEQRFWSGEFGP